MLDMPEWSARTAFQFVKQLPDSDVAQCWWHTDERRAVISLMRNQKYRPDKRTIETTVIHEVLHLLLEGHDDIDGLRDPQYESALNRLSDALWEAWQPHE